MTHAALQELLLAARKEVDITRSDASATVKQLTAQVGR
jgi:hypothetical protein